MEIHAQPQPGSKPWVDWLAGKIPDPVTRLRFLQTVAPPTELPCRKTGLAQLAATALVPVLVAALAVIQTGGHIRPVSKPIRRVVARQARSNLAENVVWLVEKTSSSEVYSNGLRIDNRFRVTNHPRTYLAFLLKSDPRTSGVRRTEPAGIVFHATQSRQAPFEAGQNGVLKKIGESLLEYVQRKRAYHFLIDRFGRVYRVVAETDAANHAGNSVWADDEWLYINLNQSFLGVAIEAQSRPGENEPEMSPAQLRAAGMLTEMLRGLYKIPGDHCVTHAQVSVNPSNMQVGYHTDWASGFPFAQLGLPDNYARPLPAIWASGFGYSPEFLEWAGERLGAGVRAGEAELAGAAAESDQSLHGYRKLLQNRYHVRLAEVRRANAAESDDSE